MLHVDSVPMGQRPVPEADCAGPLGTGAVVWGSRVQLTPALSPSQGPRPPETRPRAKPRGLPLKGRRLAGIQSL